MKSDIEISNDCKLLTIDKIASKLNIKENQYECYGKYKAKLDLSLLEQKKNKGKLILVTSINPTPYGEGKTTVSVGLNDALNKLNKKSVAVLREPSLGPVFGMKGGATGGGFAQVVPSLDINLHFTGDMHAITTANNLLSAAIDNHIYYGNQLEIDIEKIVFNRCIDINDRFLRNIEIGYNDIKIKEKYNITAASEIMAILCLASSIEDLKKRLGNIIIAYNKKNKPVFAYQLNCIDGLVILLKDAIKPNLVQTLEHNPVIIHGGPFANIAHGCNSLIATKIALNLADYVITEAGFGSDLGAEKFLDIKCQVGNIKPDAIIINVTIKSLMYNGHNDLKKGLEILNVHIENMKKYLDNVVVCINKFSNDLVEDINFTKEFCSNKNVPCILVDSYMNGGSGAIKLASEIIEITNKDSNFKPLYSFNQSIKEKINLICKQIYRAKRVIYSKEIDEKITYLENNNFDNLPVCIAKTPYSLSDDSNKIGVVGNFEVEIKDIKINNGTSFIIVYLSNVLTLPGLGKDANLYNIKIDNNLNIFDLK